MAPQQGGLFLTQRQHQAQRQRRRRLARARQSRLRRHAGQRPLPQRPPGQRTSQAGTQQGAQHRGLRPAAILLPAGQHLHHLRHAVGKHARHECAALCFVLRQREHPAHPSAILQGPGERCALRPRSDQHSVPPSVRLHRTGRPGDVLPVQCMQPRGGRLHRHEHQPQPLGQHPAIGIEQHAIHMQCARLCPAQITVLRLAPARQRIKGPTRRRMQPHLPACGRHPTAPVQRQAGGHIEHRRMPGKIVEIAQPALVQHQPGQGAPTVLAAPCLAPAIPSGTHLQRAPRLDGAARRALDRLHTDAQGSHLQRCGRHRACRMRGERGFGEVMPLIALPRRTRRTRSIRHARRLCRLHAAAQPRTPAAIRLRDKRQVDRIRHQLGNRQRTQPVQRADRPTALRPAGAARTAPHTPGRFEQQARQSHAHQRGLTGQHMLGHRPEILRRQRQRKHAALRRHPRAGQAWPACARQRPEHRPAALALHRRRWQMHAVQRLGLRPLRHRPAHKGLCRRTGSVLVGQAGRLHAGIGGGRTAMLAVGQQAAADRRTGRLQPPVEQGLQQAVATARLHCQPAGQVFAPGDERRGNRLQRPFGMRRQRLDQRPHIPAQGGLRTGRQRHAVPAAILCGQPGPGGLFQQYMHIDARQAKGTHPGPPRPAGRLQRMVARSHLDRRGNQLQTWIGPLEMRLCRHHATRQRKNRARHAECTGRGIQMTEVALHRSDQRRTGLRRFSRLRHCAEGAAQAVDLDRVPQHGGGAMRLEKIHAVQRHAGLAGSGQDHPCLCRRAGRSHARRAPVLIDRTAQDHRMNRIAIGLCRRKWLEQQRHGALARPHAIGRRIEGAGAARAGFNGKRLVPAQRGEQHTRTTGQRHRAFATLQRLAGIAHRLQRGRARGIDQFGRTVPIVQIAQAGGDAGGNVEDVAFFGPLRKAAADRLLEGLRGTGPHEHPHPLPIQRLPSIAGIFQRTGGGFQKQALLRIEQGRIAGREPEAPAVETGNVVQEGGRAQSRRVGLHTHRSEHSAHVLATLRGQLAHPVCAAEQVAPEAVRVVVVAQAQRQTDDRHRALRGERYGACPGGLLHGLHAARPPVARTDVQGLLARGDRHEQLRQREQLRPTRLQRLMQADQQQRTAADVEKTIVRTDLPGFRQNLRPQRTQRLLQRVALPGTLSGIHPGHRAPCAGRCRTTGDGRAAQTHAAQGLAIRLATGTERQAIEPVEQRRTHVVGQEGVQPAAQRGGLRHMACTRHHKGLQGGHPPHLADAHHRLGDALAALQGGLDLTQLDAETTNLHLIVAAPQIFDVAVRQPARQIAAAVHAFARHEGIGHKAFGRQPGTGQIAPRQLHAGDVQFAAHAHRHRLLQGIEHVQPGVADRPADRNAGRHAGGLAGQRQAGVPGHIHRRLGGAVEVVQLARMAGMQQAVEALHQFGRERLAAGKHPAQGRQPWHGVRVGFQMFDEGAQHGRHEMHHRHPVTLDCAHDGRRVALVARRQQRQRGARPGPPEQLPHRDIERHRGLLQNHVRSVQRKTRLHPEQAVEHAAMHHFDALRPASGAGGENHIGHRIGRHRRETGTGGAGRALIRARACILLPLGIRTTNRTAHRTLKRPPNRPGRQAKLPEHRQLRCFGEHHQPGHVFGHRRQPLLRQARQQRDIHRPDTQYRKDRDDELHRALAAHPHMTARTHPGCKQFMRQSRHPGVELRMIEHDAIAAAQGHRMRVARALAAEAVVDGGFKRPGFGGVIETVQHLLAFVGGHPREPVERLVRRPGAYGIEQHLQPLRHAGHRVLLEQCAGVFQLQRQALRLFAEIQPQIEPTVPRSQRIRLHCGQRVPVSLRRTARRPGARVMVRPFAPFIRHQHIEQRIACAVARHLERLHQRLQRIGLVFQRLSQAAGHLREQVVEPLLRHQPGAHRHGVHQKTHQRVQGCIGTTGHWHPDHQVALAGVTVQPQLDHTEQQRKQGLAGRLRTLAQGGFQRRPDAQLQYPAMRVAQRRTRPVGGQRQGFGQRTQPRHPARTHRRRLRALQPATLPHRIVHIAQCRDGPLRRGEDSGGGGCGGIGLAQFPEQHFARPAIAHQMVEHQQQHVPRGPFGLPAQLGLPAPRLRQPVQRGPHQRCPGTEGKRPRQIGGHRGGACRLAVACAYRQPQRPGAGQGLAQGAIVAQAVGHAQAQRVMARFQHAQRRIERPFIHRRGKGDRKRYVVGAGLRLQALQEPQTLLPAGQRIIRPLAHRHDHAHGRRLQCIAEGLAGSPLGRIVAPSRRPGRLGGEPFAHPRSQRPHRGMVHHVAQRQAYAKRLFQPCEQAHGLQALPAEREEIGIDLGGQHRHAEQFGKDRSNARLQRIRAIRALATRVLARLRHGPYPGGRAEPHTLPGQCRQCGTVELAIRIDRQRIDPNPGLRQHVGRQLPGQGGEQRLGVGRDIPLGTQQRQQVAVLAAASHHHRRTTHAVEPVERAFHLAQFDAVTAQFDLGIATPEIAYRAVIQPAAEIAGAIHPLAQRRRKVDKTRLCQVVASDVARRQAVSGHAQFARFAGQGRCATVVQDVHTAVGHRPADWNRSLLQVCRVNPVGGAEGAVFGGAVAIEQRQRRAGLHDPGDMRRAQRLAADEQPAQGREQSGRLIRKKVEQAGGQPHHPDLLRLDAPGQPRGRQQAVVADEAAGAAAQQGPPDFQGRGIETQRRGLQQPLARSQVPEVAVAHQTYDAPLRHHDALRRTGGAGGKQDAGGRLHPAGRRPPLAGRRQRRGCAVLRKHRVQIERLQRRALRRLHLTRRDAPVQQPLAGGKGQLLAEALRWTLLVQRQIASACLEYAQHRHHGLRLARHGQCHRGAVRQHSERSRHAVGQAVELRVSPHLAMFGHARRRVGLALTHRTEQRHQRGIAGIVARGAVEGALQAQRIADTQEGRRQLQQVCAAQGGGRLASGAHPFQQALPGTHQLQHLPFGKAVGAAHQPEPRRLSGQHRKAQHIGMTLEAADFGNARCTGLFDAFQRIILEHQDVIEQWLTAPLTCQGLDVGQRQEFMRGTFGGLLAQAGRQRSQGVPLCPARAQRQGADEEPHHVLDAGHLGGPSGTHQPEQHIAPACMHGPQQHGPQRLQQLRLAHAAGRCGVSQRHAIGGTQRPFMFDPFGGIRCPRSGALCIGAMSADEGGFRQFGQQRAPARECRLMCRRADRFTLLQPLPVRRQGRCGRQQPFGPRPLLQAGIHGKQLAQQDADAPAVHQQVVEAPAHLPFVGLQLQQVQMQQGAGFRRQPEVTLCLQQRIPATLALHGRQRAQVMTGQRVTTFRQHQPVKTLAGGTREHGAQALVTRHHLRPGALQTVCLQPALQAEADLLGVTGPAPAGRGGPFAILAVQHMLEQHGLLRRIGFAQIDHLLHRTFGTPGERVQQGLGARIGSKQRLTGERTQGFHPAIEQGLHPGTRQTGRRMPGRQAQAVPVEKGEQLQLGLGHKTSGQQGSEHLGRGQRGQGLQPLRRSVFVLRVGHR